MKLFTIIPVYRTADTLAGCIDSVLAQRLPCQHEIILVDDGSPDDAPSICDEYAKRYEGITVIHKENGGLSSARNAALDYIFGKPIKGYNESCKDEEDYITFVDSDDTLCSDTFGPLMELLSKHPETDMLEYSAQIRFGHPTKEQTLLLPDREYDDAVEYWLDTKAYMHTYAWNKIFKRRLFMQIRFPDGRNFEDAWTIPCIIGFHSPTTSSIHIMTSSKGGYRYNWNPQGICATASLEDIKSLYESQSVVVKHLLQIQSLCLDVFEKEQESWQQFLLSAVNTLIDMYDVSGRYEHPEPLVVNIVKSLPYRNSAKLKLLSLIGYHNLCRTLHLLHRLRHR